MERSARTWSGRWPPSGAQDRKPRTWKSLPGELEVPHLEQPCRQAHIDRLHAGYAERIATSEVHLDVLTNLKRISSHITAIGHGVLDT